MASVMGVFERQGNSSSFKGAGATVAATGVGFTLKTDKNKHKKINFHHFQCSLTPDEKFTSSRTCTYMFVAPEAPNTGNSSCSGSGLLIVLTVKESRRSSLVSDLLTATSPKLYQSQNYDIQFPHLEVCLVFWGFCSCLRNVALQVHVAPSSLHGGV